MKLGSELEPEKGHYYYEAGPESSSQKRRKPPLNKYAFAGAVLASTNSVLLGYGLNDNINWRLMLGLAALPAIVVVIGVIGMPESPRWLVMKGRYREARQAAACRCYSDNGLGQDNICSYICSFLGPLGEAASSVIGLNWDDSFVSCTGPGLNVPGPTRDQATLGHCLVCGGGLC
ncbi:polyol transporter 5-like [Tripterygium wilfordii]|uniref:Polyol transporter 5-like n=1 Tax=Tripterygium wilfordii TaxID=458696 RepID=A0A7J7DQE9_TRIWF|nr:polyol transporter 5-like [Tripterygium wilfordii]